MFTFPPRVERWLSTAVKNYAHKNSASPESFLSLRFFANSFKTSKNLKNISVLQAEENLKAFNEENKRKSLNLAERQDEIAVRDNISYKMLMRKEDFKEEGKRMGNCMGGNSYSSSTFYVSLRDKGMSVVNFTFRKKSKKLVLTECMGKFNQDVKVEYIPYLEEIFKILNITGTKVLLNKFTLEKHVGSLGNINKIEAGFILAIPFFMALLSSSSFFSKEILTPANIKGLIILTSLIIVAFSYNSYKHKIAKKVNIIFAGLIAIFMLMTGLNIKLNKNDFLYQDKTYRYQANFDNSKSRFYQISGERVLPVQDKYKEAELELYHHMLTSGVVEASSEKEYYNSAYCERIYPKNLEIMKCTGPEYYYLEFEKSGSLWVKKKASYLLDGNEVTVNFK